MTLGILLLGKVFEAFRTSITGTVGLLSPTRTVPPPEAQVPR